MPEESIRLVHASGECEIDLVRRELRVLGSPVPVGGRAFEIIEVLARAGGALVTKDELMNRIWPGAMVSENTLHVHTAAVRKALGPNRGLLKTESGRGYRLLGDWTMRRQDAASTPAGLQPMRVDGASPVTNFPVVVTRLVGRTAAVARVRDFVSAYRVVTLTGPGGIGKTSLALEAARGIVGEFAAGGWLVELASLLDPTLVPTAVAAALRLPTGPASVTAETVAHAIGDKKLLLVLDNCEHLIGAVATLAETLLLHCMHTTIVTTSREILRIQGEHVYRVPPLDVPAAGRDEADHILSHSAVELFIARTQAVDTEFSPRAGELRSIGAICRRLDGIPLAIEFAAAHAATVGVQHVADGLHNRFTLLTRGRRSVLPRHRTLRAVLDWSYELLSEAEQNLLRHLGIFSGGFTFEAAAAVMKDGGADPPSVMDGIAGLVAKSMVALDRDTASRGYLLETIKAYALEKIAEHNEADTAAGRHAVYFRDRFTTKTSGVRWFSLSDDLAYRVREIDNVRTALDWSFSSVGNPAVGVDLTVAYAPVWTHLLLTNECRERCERALLSLEPHVAANMRPRMRLQIALADALITTMGSATQAITVLTAALEAAEALDDVDGQSWALKGLMNVYTWRNENAKVRIVVEQLGKIVDRIDDPAHARDVYRLMGNTLFLSGRHREAQGYYERSLQFRVAPEDRHDLISYNSNDYTPARALLCRALWMQGFADKAIHEARLGVEEVDGTDQPLALCRALCFGICRIAPTIGDFATADREIARLIEVATDSHAPSWQTAGRFMQGKSLIERGEFAQGLTLLRDAFETYGRSGWRMAYPEFKGALALALAGTGLLDEALDTLQDAMTSASTDENLWYVPELLRVKGEVLLRQAADGAASAAEDCFDQAAGMAREQGTLFWELRIALSLARLRVTQGREDEAGDVLLPVYERFTEGFDTTDLRAARALLDALSGRAR